MLQRPGLLSYIKMGRGILKNVQESTKDSHTSHDIDLIIGRERSEAQVIERQEVATFFRYIACCNDGSVFQ